MSHEAPNGRELLSTLVGDPHDSRRVIVKSSLIFSEWEWVFNDPTTTAAVIDRLVRYSIILELNRTNYCSGRHSTVLEGQRT